MRFVLRFVRAACAVRCAVRFVRAARAVCALYALRALYALCTRCAAKKNKRTFVRLFFKVAV